MGPKKTKNTTEKIWTEEETLQLLDLYKCYPCLYDVVSKEYKNRGKREAAISAIIKDMEQVCMQMFIVILVSVFIVYIFLLHIG
jgi:hypothetical protein